MSLFFLPHNVGESIRPGNLKSLQNLLWEGNHLESGWSCKSQRCTGQHNLNKKYILQSTDVTLEPELSKTCLQNRKVRHHTKLTETDMEFTTFGKSLIDLYEYVIDFPLDQGATIVQLLSLLVLMMMLT